MANDIKVIKFTDCSELSKLETCNDWLFSKKDGELCQQDVLEDAYQHLLKESKKDDRIIYRPYESFTRSPKWTAGRYIGEMTFEAKNGKKNVQKYKLLILPRFGNEFLAHMLEVVNNFKMPDSLSIYAKGDNWSILFQIILRFIWVARLTKANRYGLPRMNIVHTYQGEQVRGHLNVRKSLLPIFTKNQVISEYREKEVDDTIGKIIYKAYCILSDKSLGLSGLPPQSKDSINHLLSRYNGESFTITEAEYRNIHYNSIYLCWKPLVDLSWDIIKKRGYDHENFVEEEGFSLFFDMAEIWEEYIGKVVSDYFTHYTKKNSHFSLFEGFQQTIIPDYLSNDYLDGNSTIRAVGDAKYMDLEDRDKLEGEQAQSVYYKTIMYMHRFKSKKGFIFYPLRSEATTKAEQYAIESTDSKVYMVGMHIPNCEKNEFLGRIKANEEQFRNRVCELLEDKT